jgi:hypothetical protein
LVSAAAEELRASGGILAAYVLSWWGERKSIMLLDVAESLRLKAERALSPELRREFSNAGLGLTIGSTSAQAFHVVGGRPVELVAIDEDQLAEEELLEEMGSYEKKHTGIDNIVFLSPRGRTKHAARIKVSIDPPDSFNPSSDAKRASIAIHDGSITGAYVPRDLYDRLIEFIRLNRETLLLYWDYRITTTQMEERLIAVPPRR